MWTSLGAAKVGVFVEALSSSNQCEIVQVTQDLLASRKSEL